MDLNELIVLKQTKTAELRSLVELGQAENRELKTDETERFKTIEDEIKNLEALISAKNIPNNTIINKTKNKTMEKRFNILKAISDYVNKGQFDEATLEMIQEGKRSFSDAKLTAKGQLVLPMERAALAASTSTGGQEMVAEDKWDIVGPLRNNLVCVKAGARLISGLVGDVSIPTYAGTTIGWALENGNASDGAGATAEITMTPKRLTAYIDVSKTLLDQTSFDMQQFLIDDIKNAIAAKLDASILDATASSSTRPAGLLNGVATTLVTTSFAEVVAMEAAVDTANALQGKLAYITHPNVKQLMKTTAKLSNGAAIMEGDMANGYPVLVSSAIPTGATTSKGIIYGNWNDLIIGQWGGLDIIIDPYTQAIAGKVRLIVNANFNWAKVRTDSFTAKYLG